MFFAFWKWKPYADLLGVLPHLMISPLPSDAFCKILLTLQILVSWAWENAPTWLTDTWGSEKGLRISPRGECCHRLHYDFTWCQVVVRVGYGHLHITFFVTGQTLQQIHIQPLAMRNLYPNLISTSSPIVEFTCFSTLTSLKPCSVVVYESKPWFTSANSELH